MKADITQWWTWDPKRYEPESGDTTVGYAMTGMLCDMANKASIVEWGKDVHDSAFVSICLYLRKIQK